MARRSSVKGFQEARAVLRKLPDRIQERVLQQAATAAVRLWARDVRKAAPIGKQRSAASAQYGPLRKNIRVVRLRRVPRGSKGARVSTGDGFWGLFYEKGTQQRFNKRGKSAGAQPARAWFEPTIRRGEMAVLVKFVEALTRGIGREAQRLAGNLPHRR